ncbi:unnamed protein product [Rhizophagus irregularis]|nr:unnamed protein product [Rhizophagus irregularis]
MAKNKFLTKLSQNLLEILDDNEYYGITIEVEIFQIILRYIYGGSLSLEEFDTSDIIKILITASKLSLEELIPHLQSFLIKNKANWMEQKKILTSLIQNNILQISEVQIWEHVLKWGIAQNPGLLLDPSSYLKDGFNVLKNTLQRCYSKKLYKSLIECFLDNDYNPSDKLGPKIIKETIIRESIDSKIITVQYVELISKWIDSNEILGRYNPIVWKSVNGFSTTNDCFIFSFMNKNINDHVISRVKKDKYSINYWDRYGPSFGRDDLIIRGGTVNNYWE